ncbi:MAG: hypothetical protein BWY91_02252 [bacterium ADurb.BinA028]|nr:MAG: hypothetical protein BWY91_02252 [bacterium ADurb.BinA028]
MSDREQAGHAAYLGQCAHVIGPSADPDLVGVERISALFLRGSNFVQQHADLVPSTLQRRPQGQPGRVAYDQ